MVNDEKLVLDESKLGHHSTTEVRLSDLLIQSVVELMCQNHKQAWMTVSVWTTEETWTPLELHWIFIPQATNMEFHEPIAIEYVK